MSNFKRRDLSGRVGLDEVVRSVDCWNNYLPFISVVEYYGRRTRSKPRQSWTSTQNQVSDYASVRFQETRIQSTNPVIQLYRPTQILIPRQRLVCHELERDGDAANGDQATLER